MTPRRSHAPLVTFGTTAKGAFRLCPTPDHKHPTNWPTSPNTRTNTPVLRNTTHTYHFPHSPPIERNSLWVWTGCQNCHDGIAADVESGKEHFRKFLKSTIMEGWWHLTIMLFPVVINTLDSGGKLLDKIYELSGITSMRTIMEVSAWDVDAYSIEWWLWCQNQVSQAGISNCIPQQTVGCNYLSLPEITETDTCFWYQSPQMWPRLLNSFHRYM